MNDTDKQLIRDTWAQVVPIADTAASLFYARLFETDPSAAALFGRTDMPAQRRKLVQAIGSVVAALDDLDPVVDVLRGLGRRHAVYGVVAGHYDTVGAALLWTLEAGLGDAWSDAAADAWAAAYGLIAAVMQVGAEEAVAAE